MLIIDSLAWICVRVMGLFIEAIGEGLMAIINPSPMKDYKLFQALVSLCATGELLFHSPNPDTFPDVMRPQLLMVGRLFLLSISIMIYGEIIHKIFLVPYLGIR